MRLHGHLLVLVSILLLSTPAQAGGVTCSSAGMFNPITDVCWDCIFPIRVGSVPIVQGRYPDEQTEGSPIGFCPAPPPIFQRVGVNISYWEPYSLVDVVKEPYCLESMGMSVGSSNPLKMGGTDTFKGGGKPDRKGGFYDVHWYKYPIFALLEVLESVVCGTSGGLDMAYITEIDPLWHQEDTAAILHPEVFLFNNPIAALACIADATKTLLGTSTAIDALFWCQGSQGLVYPFTGQTSERRSGISNAVLLMERFNFKLHRQGVVNETHSGNPANCMATPDPILPKSRYRYQMTRPTPSPDACYPYGTTAIRWEAGRNNPVTGRDNYSFINWRKHSCMAL
ncbi:conjugal transfer pilus assembly protein TraU [Vibrio sp. 10N.261.46.E12]|uniref:conjugal transfer pilus assembly protein TraU n=1 Tax=Vibrio TaxID=662 RepID=UPI000976C1F7|nr:MULTISPECIES: conjugal transfer pilus assembly protein TraU [Vibrio]OMO35725.1 conjugal transfer protein TraU [Vibrio sp. 10N.261.45.E1]PMJ22885.1 conjugal transfer protein TraU [Vibrio sp. 10N.286.45.B6]PML87214.1 conjugal transfer protein TraU [Vibrio sp. 10N.261.49.E11]PMM38683.1 conjugal transfer protein TraU [Vibrio lentus]PMM67526.1 conjugal transfer protein TraU [Vibrio sp. 10N.261.46.F12]